MEEYKLNIPSVISHSYFTLLGKKTHLDEKEVNYFYSLLYLFRKNIIDESKVKIFNKIGKDKMEINEEFENFTVKIELVEFDDMGVVSNNSYGDLKTFFKKLKNREMVINILGKDKTIDTQSIRLIESFKIKDNILHIQFTEELVYLILHTTDYFMKVDLNLLFKIKGYKSKKLYLFIKDYSLFGNECIKISKENLENLIGRIPTKKRFEIDIENTYKIKTIVKKEAVCINSDLKIEYPAVTGRKLKKYEFRFKNLIEKNTDKESDEKQSSIPIEEIAQNVKDDVDKRIDEKIKSGKKIKNLEGYKYKSYQTENEKRKPKGSEESIAWLENFVNSKINILKEDLEFEDNKYYYFGINYKQYPTPLHIDNNYCIFNSLGDVSTTNVDETIKYIEDLIKNKKIDGLDDYNIYSYSDEIINCNNVFRIRRD